MTKQIDGAVPSEKNLTQKASKNVFWTLLNSGGVSFIRFLNTAILARILTPEDFGIHGMAALMVGIITLFGNLGMGGAIIQKKEIDTRDLSTTFWVNVGSGVILAFLTILASPFIAAFFREEILKSIMLALSINFIFSGLANTHFILLMRDLKFKRITITEIICTFIRVAIMLAFALNGFGVWSIIIGIIGERIIKTILFILQSHWQPQLIFDKERFRHLFRFGRNTYGYGFIDYINSQMDYIITGRMLGSIDLGFYKFAYAVPHLVLTHIAGSIRDVVYPLYCRVQSEVDRISRGYIKTTNYISLVTFPLMFGLFYVAEDFIYVVYGGKWEPAILPLKILCFSAALISVTKISFPLCASQGKPEFNLRWILVVFPVTILAVVFSVRWGVVGVAGAMSVLSLLSLIFINIALRLIKTPMKVFFASLKPAAVGSLLMLTGLWAFDAAVAGHDFSRILRLFIHFVLGAGIYIFAIRGFFRENFYEILNFAKQMFKKV